MDPEKIKAILEWKSPYPVKGVQSFLGFANLYRLFIKDFSKLAAPPTALTRKGVQFIWSYRADQAFKTLKEMFTSAPMLIQFNPKRETVLETDSSG